MKKTITILMLCLCCVARANDVTIWGLGQQNLDSRNNQITARVGLEIEQIEPFLASTWWPKYDTAGKVEPAPPQVFSAGCLYHWQNILDPNSPIPWIPDILSELVPPEMIAEPYFGGQASLNLDKDGLFIDGMIGLKIKTEKKSNTALITELNYPDFGGKLKVLPDKWYLNIGFRIKF